jgi:3-deoxy-D-manno-octulosonic-acid transferase
MPGAPPLAAYDALTSLARPLLRAWLAWRAVLGRELTERISERFGANANPPHPGPWVWVHAASLGEAATALPIVQAIERRGYAVVLTTGTVSSARLLTGRLGPKSAHRFAPLDVAPWVGRFLDGWRPVLAARMESEIWPVTLDQLKRRDIPSLVVNGRLSDSALRGWNRAPGLARAVFGAITMAIAQSKADADRYRHLGVKNAVSAGNIKFSVAALSYNPAALARLRGELGTRPRWLAASIHPGEDTICANAHALVRDRLPGAVLVAAPRHPDRAAAMAHTFTAAGLNVARRSMDQALTPETDVYLADTVGELGLFYRLCPVTFIGKTFVVGGGQNPVEAAQLGCALIWGSDMSNFRDIAAQFQAERAAIAIDNPTALGAAIIDSLLDKDGRTAMAVRAEEIARRQSGALAATLALMEPYLPDRGIN